MKVNEIGMFEAKTHLADVIQRVLRGETFYITRRKKRVAELRPVEREKKALTRGCASNDAYLMASDFDGPMQDMKEYE
jgi:antitoxin (DNA-binding transcriptional repressor) of toxin-antitoxin stability system